MDDAQKAPAQSAETERAVEVAKGLAAVCLCNGIPCAGLDCGPYLPGQAPRKKMARKSPEELARIRAKAWATRRGRLVARSLAGEG